MIISFYMIKKKKKLRTKRNKQFIKQFINELEKKKIIIEKLKFI